MNRKQTHIALVATLACCLNAFTNELPAGFVVETVAEGLQQPVAIAFDGSGRIFIAEKTGAIRIIENGILRDEPFATIDVYTFLECGLLGLALDPDFSDNGYVYVFATVDLNEQQILRLTDDNGVGVDRTVIRGFLPTTGTLHNGGCLKVGPDNKLYFSIGDTDSPETSQDLASLAGSICRINLDGSTPDDNPFATPTGSPRAQVAYGFRNPFRFEFMPDGRLFVLDIGSDLPHRTEEINLVSSGDNCGWPLKEGTNTENVGVEVVEPAYTYIDKGSAPTGALHYDATQFPATYRGDYFHADYVSNAIFHVEIDGDRVTKHEQFALLDGGPVELALSPDGSIYVAEVIGGRIERIVFPAGQSQPMNEPDNSNENTMDNTNADSNDPNDDAVTPQPAAPCAAPMAMLLTSLAFAARRKFSN